jgi:hypothetical protein
LGRQSEFFLWLHIATPLPFEYVVL